MAISIPIIAEWNGGNVLEKARQEFNQLEGAGKKAQYAIKKAAVPAAAALTAVGAALFDATKGAIEDAAAQDALANQLRKTTGATDAQINSVENFVSEMGRVRAVADDEVRPALAQLVRATGDVTRAQQLFKTAQDIAASTGKNLTGVVMALSKAEQGQYAGLKKLGIPMGDNTRALMDQAAASNKAMKAQAAYNAALEGGDSKEIAKKLEKLKQAQEALNAVTVPGADYIKDLDKAFGGAGEAAANTAAGGFKRLQISMAETKESIGAALLPAIERILPYLTKFADWAQKNPTLFLTVAGAIAAIAASIMAVNLAMALNPFSAIAAGIALLVVGVIAAYNKFETFRNVVRSVVNGIASYFEFMVNAWATAINLVIRGINLVKPGKDIPSIGKINIGRLGEEDATRGLADSRIVALASGGIVTAPTLAMVGEGGEPEAVIPLSRMGDFGMGGGNVTIHVNGGDPQAVVDALTRWYRQNGPLPVKVA